MGGGYYQPYEETEEGFDRYYPANGAVYHPAANTWTPMSLADAPAYTVGDSAVWTGAKMIVYRGNRLESYSYNTVFSGGSYNPANNTWSAISSNSYAGTSFNRSAV